MGSMPLPALDIRPPENPLDQYAKALSVKSMISGQANQAEELKARQLQNQSSQLDIQQKQLELQNNSIRQSLFSDPNFESDYADWLKQKGSNLGTVQQPGGDSSVPVSLNPLAQYMVERKGLHLFGKGGGIETSDALNESAQKIATLKKTQGEAANQALEAHSKQLDNFDSLVEPILADAKDGKIPDDQIEQRLGQMRNEILSNKELYPPEAVQHIDTMSTIKGLQEASNTSKVRQMIIEDGTKQAEAQAKQAEAAQKTQLASGIKDKDGVFTPQARTAMDTIKNYAVGAGGAIPPAMVAGLTKEMQNAPDMESLQKIQARADNIDESFQRSADARAQASAMKDVATKQVVAGKLVAEDQKLGTALDQTGGIRQLLDMSKGGNEVATSAVQVRFAEHEIVEGGVKRMNRLELEKLATSLGSYGRKFQSWVDSGFEGSMPASTNKDMQTILDAEDANANATHERNVGYISNRYAGVSPTPSKNVATGSGAFSVTAPDGSIHNFTTQAQVDKFKQLAGIK